MEYSGFSILSVKRKRLVVGLTSSLCECFLCYFRMIQRSFFRVKSLFLKVIDLYSNPILYDIMTYKISACNPLKYCKNYSSRSQFTCCVQLLRITTHNKLFQTSSAILSSFFSMFRSAAQIKTVSGEIGKSLYFDLMILENNSASASKFSKSLSGTVFFTSSFIFIFPFYRLCCQHLT